MGRRRAWTLALVHVAVFAHILQWKLSGRTLSPLEPSEAMYTLLEGAVNAGAILLLLSVASTLLIGRYFCGWTCHLVAVQDLCAWLMKKVGVHPRPLRSRWLVWVPLLAGLYMFFWPSFMRLINSRPSPDYTLTAATVQKVEFWETFPGFWVGLLSLFTCGAAMIYVLGAKGFCTYACPYGGIFGVVDRLSVGRIVVSDACKGCGHCTAVCTSNVVVHEEVRDYGMVVDPGCMKCMDCVSVCPENALSFGLGRPALFAKKRTKVTRAARWSLNFGEEVALVLVFVFALVVFRGVANFEWPGSGRRSFVWAEELYGTVPLLWALGLSALTAFVAVYFVRLFRARDVAFQWFTLRKDGALTTSGRAFAGLAGAWMLFMAHSAFVQYHTFQGNRFVEATAPIADAVWRQDKSVLGALPNDVKAAVDASAAHFATARAAGLVEDVRIARQEAWLAMIRMDLPEAERILRGVIANHSDFDFAYSSLAQVLAWSGRMEEAVATLSKGIEARPASVRLTNELAELLTNLGDTKAAMQRLRTLVNMRPEEVGARIRLATLASVAGDPAEAVRLCEEVLKLRPNHVAAHYRLALALGLANGDPQRILGHLEAAATGAVNDVNVGLTFGDACLQYGQPARAEAVLRRLKAENPSDGRVLETFAAVVDRLGRQDEARAARTELQRLAPVSRPASESR